MPLWRPAFPGSFREESDFEKVPPRHGAWAMLRLNQDSRARDLRRTKLENPRALKSPHGVVGNGDRL